MHSYTNRLAGETSPYLLQHAHNPVDWYPWGTEAFEKARQEDKPILVSIGYAACHWCHVMERESFEDPAVAAIMNEHFVNIKVDREERPDVDHIYMDAVQAISGTGGWPLNVFLMPDGKPFYGGTYFPPQRAFNRASWSEVLQAIAQTYREGREKITEDAEALTQHLKATNAFGAATGAARAISPDKIHAAFGNVMKAADKVWGGFGKAPKFPQAFTISFLLHYGHLNNHTEAKAQALLSLDKMMQGGIYDHVGGGFARYSTDREWLVPHFEKMLYDNALLVAVLAEAYLLTREEKYKEVIEETLQFVERELMHPDGGFYSALDADSEGEEGRFYVWDQAEVEEMLGDEAPLFCRYFGITEEGNWEGKNILCVQTPLDAFAQENGIDIRHLKAVIRSGKEKLLQKRAGRVRPQLDDKVLLSWNSLMNLAYTRAYVATGGEQYKAVAIRNMEFLLSRFKGADGLFSHTWKNGQAKYPAFLDDYSYLIAAAIELGQVTADVGPFQTARSLTQLVLEGFADTATPLFFFTHAQQTDILIRKKEVQDGATPSGNAMMAANLYRLSILFDLPDWRKKAEAMMAAMGDAAIKYPTAFGVWLNLLYEMVEGTAEIAIVGKDWPALLKGVQTIYLPHKIIIAHPHTLEDFPLLKNKDQSKTLIYLCRDYSCERPVETVESFEMLLKSNN